MKHIILSADSTPSVYLVPDKVSDNLKDYCNDFWEWMQTSPHAGKYRVDFNGIAGLCYTESDFIEYLNTWVFHDKPCKLIETLHNGIPQKYKDCVQFNF